MRKLFEVFPAWRNRFSSQNMIPKSKYAVFFDREWSHFPEEFYRKIQGF